MKIILILYKTKFTLLGTINHIGDINEGHYFSKDHWYEFNDDKVQRLNKMIYKSNTVCLFIYTKI